MHLNNVFAIISICKRGVTLHRSKLCFPSLKNECFVSNLVVSGAVVMEKR